MFLPDFWLNCRNYRWIIGVNLQFASTTLTSNTVANPLHKVCQQKEQLSSVLSWALSGILSILWRETRARFSAKTHSCSVRTKHLFRPKHKAKTKRNRCFCFVSFFLFRPKRNLFNIQELCEGFCWNLPKIILKLTGNLPRTFLRN